MDIAEPRGIEFTYRDYLAHVSQYIADNPELRSGQAYLHVLCRVRPDISRELGPNTDPWMRDANLPAFLEFVKRHW